jgi:hypothetical protein
VADGRWQERRQVSLLLLRHLQIQTKTSATLLIVALVPYEQHTLGWIAERAAGFQRHIVDCQKHRAA